ncbi:uncharacterized protein LOC134264573 [Saccostrea cucullata]|uniref:uncharacterized protein LOC134264573 n=1 Tax=Saccostrea cuccullata TaxID=36930 RepID=UPI002ED484AC
MDEIEKSEKEKKQKSGKTFKCSRCFSKFKKYDDMMRHKTNDCHMNQSGSGEGQAYSVSLARERTFMKTKAREKTYEVQFHEKWQGRNLRDLHRELNGMFETALDKATAKHPSTDLGRVVVHHKDLEPIMVPLRPLENLTAPAIMDTIQNVLNSHQKLKVDSSFHLDIGIITMPKGGKVYLNQLTGENNSLKRKQSIIQIVNDDNMCMARAIAVTWGRSIECSKEEWQSITQHRGKKTNLDLIMEFRKMPRSHFKNMIKPGAKQQTELAKELLRQVGLPSDRKCTILDIQHFETYLERKITVLDASLGNRICYRGQDTEFPQLFLYLVGDDHFHAVVSVTGFFCSSYFCKLCLKPYTDKNRHYCGKPCIVCKRAGKCP